MLKLAIAPCSLNMENAPIEPAWPHFNNPGHSVHRASRGQVYYVMEECFGSPVEGERRRRVCGFEGAIPIAFIFIQFEDAPMPSRPHLLSF